MFFKPILYLCGLLLVAASFEEQSLQDLTMDDQAATAPKINWLPVWQEHEQAASDPNHARSDTQEVMQADPINENSSSEEHTLSVSNDRADSCGDSENSGVRRLIREARAILPLQRLTNILVNAAQDPEVINLRRLLRSSEFRGKLARLRATNEHRLLHAYSCQRLYINYERYIEYVRLFLNVHLNADSIEESNANNRPGIRGLLQNLRAALPVDRLRALYQRLVANDRELATTVNRVRSSQFRQLVKNYRDRVEYRDVRILLERAGVPLKGVADLVANALGWQGVDIAAETAILSV